jgi:3-hydroxyisobutyrate dehydrogenase-like beta-hydroxyacid dehydrogenase
MKVAFLGLGIMGSRMAANLAAKGFDLSVWNRTAATAERFCAEHPSVRLGATPADAASGAEVIVTMVVDGPQVEAVLLGPDGAADGAAAGALCVDCTTIGPTASRSIGERLTERGLSLVDAPVTGSSPRAEDGTLTIMVGASDADLERARPVLEAMGKVIVHAGPLGHGQLVKVISNSVSASNASILAQALLVGARAGANLDALIAAMAGGSAASTMLDLKAGKMRTHDYEPLNASAGGATGAYFKLEHMLKDVQLCLEEGEAVGAPFPFAALAREILVASMALGHANDDFSALIDTLERAAGIRLDQAG